MKLNKEFSKEQKKVLDTYWEKVTQANNRYFCIINRLEEKISKELGVEIEIFHNDACAVGFGDYNREYKLYHK